MDKPAELLAALENFYGSGRRDMPWRHPEPDGSFAAYKIMVSEFMLQQTQVARVVPKYHAFLKRFPTIDTLAQADFGEVVAAWVGLGYNRRAQYLWQAARRLMELPEPWTAADLTACKGIGPNTAAAILTYSYDAPAVFVETNIRTVIIRHFFADKEAVADKAVLQALGEVTDKSFATRSPREFYWAMMDYGAHLKSTEGNLSRQSKAYARQSPFAGSNRQIRGQVIRLLTQRPMSRLELAAHIPDARLPDIIAVLQEEELINFQDNMLMLYNGK